LRSKSSTRSGWRIMRLRGYRTIFLAGPAGALLKVRWVGQKHSEWACLSCANSASSGSISE